MLSYGFCTLSNFSLENQLTIEKCVHVERLQWTFLKLLNPCIRSQYSELHCLHLQIVGNPFLLLHHKFSLEKIVSRVFAWWEIFILSLQEQFLKINSSHYLTESRDPLTMHLMSYWAFCFFLYITKCTRFYMLQLISTTTLEKVLLFAFYKWNWKLERLSHLAKITSLVHDRAGVQRALWFQAHQLCRTNSPFLFRAEQHPYFLISRVLLLYYSREELILALPKCGTGVLFSFHRLLSIQTWFKS